MKVILQRAHRLSHPARDDTIATILTGAWGPREGVSDMAARTAKAERTSAETQIRLSLNLDGEGKVHVDTGFGMLDHMLTLTFFWARMDLELKCTGDMQVDAHHTTEDCALAAFPWTRLSAR